MRAWEIISEIARAILVMSIAGSVLTLLLFAIKPLIKDRLPKTSLYYMWVLILAALLVPFSTFLSVPVSTPMTPVQELIASNVRTTVERREAIAQERYSVPYEELDTDKKIDIAINEVGLMKGDFNDRILGALVFTWLFAFLADTTRYFIFVIKLRRGRIIAKDDETALLRELCCDRRIPHLYRNPLAPTPMLVGMLRPTIYLPDAEYSEVQLRNILLHELTHLRRHDVAVKWIAALAVHVHWFNPIVHLMRREIDRACELACDESVIQSLGTEEKQNYGNTLIAVVAERGHKTPKTVLSTTMCEEKKALKERLGAIMKFRRLSKKAAILSGVLLAVVLCTAVVLGAASGASDSETEAIPEYPINADGLTYGSSQYAYSVETLPDLIAAGSVDGVEFYLRTQDILDAMPKTAEEAQRGIYLATRFSMYEKDGKTVVGAVGDGDYSFAIQFLPAAARTEYAIPAYPVNENGQTYGTSAWAGPNNPVSPDLVDAVGIDGTRGYVYATDLAGEQPNNPEEAIEYMNRLEERYEEMRKNDERYVRVIPLYAEDGVTVIGEFGIGPGVVMNEDALREAIGTENIESIRWHLVYEAKIFTYETVSVSQNPIITPGMDPNWIAYDLTDNYGNTFVLILRKSDNDFTAVLESDGKLLAGMIDNGVTPALYAPDKNGVDEYI